MARSQGRAKVVTRYNPRMALRKVMAALIALAAAVAGSGAAWASGWAEATMLMA